MLFAVIKRSSGMKDSLLGKIKDLGYIERKLCAAFYASFDLLELFHDGFNFFFQTLVGQADAIRVTRRVSGVRMKRMRPTVRA